MNKWDSRDIEYKIADWLTRAGQNAIPEMLVGRHANAIDCGTDDYEYGIELKSGASDMSTGFGLNQELFLFGYLLVPQHFIYSAIGRLYCGGYYMTGVLYFDGDDVKPEKLRCAKDATGNIRSRHKNKSPVMTYIGGFNRLYELLTSGVTHNDQ